MTDSFFFDAVFFLSTAPPVGVDLDGDMTGKGLGGKDVCPRGEEPAVLGDGCGEGAIGCMFVRDRGDEPAVLGVGIICLGESL